MNSENVSKTNHFKPFYNIMHERFKKIFRDHPVWSKQIKHIARKNHTTKQKKKQTARHNWARLFLKLCQLKLRMFLTSSGLNICLLILYEVKPCSVSRVIDNQQNTCRYIYDRVCGKYATLDFSLFLYFRFRFNILRSHFCSRSATWDCKVPGSFILYTLDYLFHYCLN